MTSSRVANLETSNASIWSNLSVTSSRVANLETSNASIWSNLSVTSSRVANLETSNASIWSNLSVTSSRVANLETSNASIWSNLSVTSSRIGNLETSNASIWSNLNVTSTRIGNLETSNATAWSRLNTTANLSAPSNTFTANMIIQGSANINRVIEPIVQNIVQSTPTSPIFTTWLNGALYYIFPNASATALTCNANIDSVNANECYTTTYIIYNRNNINRPYITSLNIGRSGTTLVNNYLNFGGGPPTSASLSSANVILQNITLIYTSSNSTPNCVISSVNPFY